MAIFAALFSLIGSFVNSGYLGCIAVFEVFKFFGLQNLLHVKTGA